MNYLETFRKISFSQEYFSSTILWIFCSCSVFSTILWILCFDPNKYFEEVKFWPDLWRRFLNLCSVLISLYLSIVTETYCKYLYLSTFCVIFSEALLRYRFVHNLKNVYLLTVTHRFFLVQDKKYPYLNNTLSIPTKRKFRLT